MFSRIHGSLIERTRSGVVLDASGLAYEIILPPCVADKVTASPGDTVTLEVHSVFNIEGNTGHVTFYVFGNAIVLEFFEALITVGSIGPRSAARA